MIGRKQAIEDKQAGEERTQPQNCRADPGKQRQVWSDRERDHANNDEKEERTHERAAADTNGEAHVTHEEGGQSVHVGSRLSSRARSRPIAPCAAATTMPPLPRCPRINSASRFCDGVSSDEVGSSSSHRDRGTAIRRAMDKRLLCPDDK